MYTANQSKITQNTLNLDLELVHKNGYDLYIRQDLMIKNTAR